MLKSTRMSMRTPVPKMQASFIRRRSLDLTTCTKTVSWDPSLQDHPLPNHSDVEKADVPPYTTAENKAASKREGKIRWSVLKKHPSLLKKNEENLNAQGIFTKEDVSMKIEAIRSSVQAVLQEQDDVDNKFFMSKHKQKKRKSKSKKPKRESASVFVVNAEKIAKVYRPHSQLSLQEAQSRALRHEKHMRELAGNPSIAVPSLAPSRQSKKVTTRQRVPKVPSVVTFKKVASSKRLPRPSLSAFDTVPRESRVSNPAA